jgi:transcriptional regulator with XRE-family HTH domain
MRPSLETLIKIANVLNVDIKDLLISTKKQYGIMYISKVSFVNYKNFVNAIVYLNKGINTIIDKNDSGKTNLFRAILLLEDASIQYAYKLTKNNFEQKLGNGKEIKLLSDYII